ncbi:MAG: asparagine synthase (glutamine-hydrolyzing) [Acidobacteria bacterium]|nr:asparagine synthase (glutamine-hydrolyzing) [Acidobacteriota bacterium]
MCGIFGIITERPVEEAMEAARAATRALGHRGPDDEGLEVVSQPGERLSVIFGHRRLSILDLSAAGHQPMTDESNGNRITYNGEVFNFREVRKKLEERGLGFKSESDTEVILKGIGHLGVEAIDAWRGMFAIGFWNAGDRELMLIRDRLGIKPLYYFQDGSTFIFGSEIRALLATGFVPRSLCTAAVESYLDFGSVQQPLTIVENVYQLLPGHTLKYRPYNSDRPQTEPYWEIRASGMDKGPVDKILLGEEVNALLLESVRLRMVSDVPVGVFLSGGIDSSSIVSLMRRATCGEIRSFSVCFSEEEFSEREQAERIARHYGTHHESLLVTGGEALDKLPNALKAMDQPSIDGINSYIVSEATAQAGMKVAISGLGGDEAFCGYGFFKTVDRDERMRSMVRNLPLSLRRAAAAAVRSGSTGHRAARLSSLLRSNHLGEHSVLLHRRLFTDEQRHRLMKNSGARPADRNALEAWNSRITANCDGADPINQASALELGGYMCNMLLRDTDAMSMAHGLEVRVPLIDHKVIEKMLSIPGPVKMDSRTPKWMLVNAASDLPREIIDRPKRGFELPFRHWLQGAMRPRVEAALQSRHLGEVLNREAVDDVWRSFIEGRLTWARAWSLFALGEWMEINL